MNGQQFLIKRLSKPKGKEGDDAGSSKVLGLFKQEAKKSLGPEIYKFVLFPMTGVPEVKAAPKQVKSSQEGGKEGRGDKFLVFSDSKELNHKLFTINLCAVLRIIFNGLSFYPGENNVDVILDSLNNKEFIRSLLSACSFAGWHHGFISSKFLRLIRIAIDQSLIKKSSSNFLDQIGFYHMIFNSLGTIMDFFQKRFKNENLKHFGEKELNMILEIIKTARKVMFIVEKSICDNEGKSEKSSASSGDSKKEKEFYDIYSDKESTPLQELIRWVFTIFVPDRFIEIIILILCKIESTVQKVDFILKRVTSKSLIDFICEYLKIFPKKRFDLICYFYEKEITEGFKVRASLVGVILRKSFLFVKMQRLEEYMHTKQAGRGYMKAGETIEHYSTCLYNMYSLD
jgi:hypothetical protein